MSAPTKRTLELTDPRALRALAHPTRLRLVGLLRTHGSLTATQAAALLGQTSGNCSFHLRQLARYGLVEEVPLPGRAKPWRATAWYTSWPGTADDPDYAAAAGLLSRVVVDRYIELMHGWIDNGTDESPEWRQAAWFGDVLICVTPDELTAAGEAVTEVLAPYVERVFRPELRPDGARMVSALQIAVPREISMGDSAQADGAP